MLPVNPQRRYPSALRLVESDAQNLGPVRNGVG